MSVSKRLRYEVLRRDNHACRYCGGTAPGVRLTVDHVVPVALGGADTPANLVAACVDCNSGKSATPPGGAVIADVRADAFRWAAAMAEARRIIQLGDEQRERRREYVYACWMARFDDDGDLPPNWQQSVDALIEAGASYDDIEEAADITAGARARDPWAYFCGVCWRRVAVTQDIARQLLAREDGA